jgi:hypothetical protein
MMWRGGAEGNVEVARSLLLPQAVLVLSVQYPEHLSRNTYQSHWY